MSLVETLHRQHLERQLRIMRAAYNHQLKAAPKVVVVVRPQKAQKAASAAPEPEPFPEADDRRYTTKMDTIRKAVAQHFGVRKFDLLSDRRTADLVLPRQVTFYLGRKLTTLSLPIIGKHMGRRDHTTVLHGVRTIARKLEQDEQLRASIEYLTEQLGGDPE